MYQHIIMNRNSLEGSQIGTFPRLANLYLQTEPVDGRPSVWVEELYKAKRFDIIDEAWDYAMRYWGMEFVNEHFMVVTVHGSGLRKSEAAHTRDASSERG